MGDRRYTAYCGLYCRDCIPSKSKLFQKIRGLEKMLIELGFAKYAEFKANRYDIYKQFPVFMDLLKEMQRLECTVPCCEGPSSGTGCAQDC